MRTKVNNWCMLLTGKDSTAPRETPQITVPRFRLRLYASEAEQLAGDLMEAAGAARKAMLEVEDKTK